MTVAETGLAPVGVRRLEVDVTEAALVTFGSLDVGLTDAAPLVWVAGDATGTILVTATWAVGTKIHSFIPHL